MGWYPNQRNESLCKFCKNYIETHEHLFNECAIVRDYMAYIRNKYGLEIADSIQKEIYLNGGTQGKNFKGMAKFEIWKLRNKITFENYDIERGNILIYLKRRITTRVECSLEILERVYRDKGKTQEFRRKYWDLLD